MSEGYIYILSNPTFKELYKVGKTSRDPYERAEELSSATGIPTPFKVEYCIYVSDCDEMEEKIHDVLEKRGFRVSENREFFKASIKQIKRVIFKVKKLNP